MLVSCLPQLRRALVASALLFALPTAPASAALVLLDNTAQGTAELSTGGNSVYDNLRKAVVFSTSADLDLAAITVGLVSTTSAGSGSGTFSLYGVDGANNPTGTPLATVTTPSTAFTTSAAYYSFALSGMSITAGTAYALVLSDFNINGTPSGRWLRLEPNGQPSGSNGITYIGYRSTSGVIWAESFSLNSIYLQGTSAPVPEPASVTLVGTALAGLLAARRRRRTAKAR